MLRRAVILMAVVAFGAVGAAPASAHVSPAGCRVNGIDLQLAKSLGSPAVLRQGDTITFLIGIGNTNNLLGIPCDVTDATVGFAPPNADGTANLDPGAPTTPIVSHQSYPSGFAFRRIGSFTWTVKLNPDVEFAYALARVSGKLHDTAPDHTFADVVKNIGFQVTNPKLTLDKVGSLTHGQAPLHVTYTYVVRNTSTTPVPMNQVSVSDDLCANPTYASGDDGDGLLSNGESWTFTCSALHQAPGVYTDTATACAHSTVPGDTTRPVCSPPDHWTVTVTPPPTPPKSTPPPPPPGPPAASPPPKGGVKGATATKCVKVRRKHLKVRAHERTTVRVRVRVDGKNIRHARVRVRGAGVRMTRRTNKHGIARFHVRPKRKGRLTISSNQCDVRARVSVKPARRVVAPALPQVTG